MSAASADGGRRAQALRALDVSGRRLVERGDGWVVIGRDARRRPVVRIEAADARALIAAGQVSEAEGGGFVRADGAPAKDAEARQAAPFDARAAARGIIARRGGAGFSGLAMLAARGEGPLSRHAAQAGLQLQALAERAASLRGLTMNWSATPLDRSARRTGDGGMADGARRASMRLQRMRATLGEEAFALAWAACVEAQGVGALERRFGLGARRGATRLAETLERMADVMEGVGF